MSRQETTLSFEVLAEPNRRTILDLLRVRELPVGELVSRLSLTQPAVSKHLRILREAGMVEVRADARRRLYRVRAEGLRGLDRWIRPYRKMWEASLDKLENHLDAMADD
jgi:DNA-binding transcriptional ArsR family regulator